MKLFYSATSPYVRKVMVLLHETGQLADVELLQFDDGILDLRSGAFDAGGVSSPAVEAPVAGPGFAADLEPLLTPVV